MFQSKVAPSADWLQQPTDRGRADCPSLKGEVSNHKGIFDETR